jgi:alkylhydroperoxidase family enzyme
MAVDRKTGLPEVWKITTEMMVHPKPRIPYIEPGKIPDELKAELEPIYARSMASWGSVPRYYQMLAYSPGLIEGWHHIETRVRFAYKKTDPDFLKILTMVITKTAMLNHSNYCTGHNVDLGRSIGFDWDKIDAIEEGSQNKSLSDREKAALRWAEVVTDRTAYDDDAAFAELKKHFTTKQIVEMTFMCGMWNLSARLTEPFHQTVEPPEARIAFKAK